DTVTPAPAAPQVEPSPTEPAPQQTAEAPQTQPAAPEPTQPSGVQVVAADYVGRPADEVERELKDLGLEVETRDERDTDAAKGTVIWVSEGTFEPGDTVTVTVADPKDGPADRPGKGNDDTKDD
ncbi:MAG: PASTA domain-containing protein, partial [Actinomycetota bacterium]